MFTGIIEEIGTVKNLEKSSNGAVIHIESKKILDDVALGKYTLFNGACQTVTQINEKGFSADVSHETLNITTLKYLVNGEKASIWRELQELMDDLTASLTGMWTESEIWKKE